MKLFQRLLGFGSNRRLGTWTPALLTGLEMWLDASDDSTFTLASSKVSQWRDKSVNARHVSQATDANRPTFSSSGLYGVSKPAVVWPSVGNSCVLSGASNINMRNIIVVAGYAESVSVWIASFQGLVGPANIAVGLIGNSSDANWYSGNTFSSVSKNGAAQVNINAAPALPLSPSILYASAASVVNDTFALGEDRAFGGRGWSGPISEVIITSVATITLEKQKLEGYLAYKWGLTSLLPSDHPYKTFPP